jgi:hypothetical protein
VEGSDGRTAIVYTDLTKLERHLAGQLSDGGELITLRNASLATASW